ncbi:hypothetical protein [Streptacidiphilus carbonis]|jgi:hypothetical protein|uniref:hypothetical protein n=1 Tax=Streptacidiphilus carbonis TaxID=105422 RepID=UPI000ACB2FFA|nr:hypothetical protein [Streptacidiphilus carbonis]
MALFLLVVIIAMVLGIIGFVVQGLLYLLVIGCVLLLLDLAWIGSRWSRSHRRRVR